MKAADFAYERPDDLATVLVHLANEDLEMQLLAGGQSLMPMMNFRLAQPEVLIDLNAIQELQFITETDTTIEIGAMTRYVELENSALVQAHIPLFVLALPHIAHAAIRNRGTIGGSCALADPAAEMPALLIALNAVMRLVSQAGEREVMADEFFLELYDTALEEGELIRSISIPKAQPTSKFGFYELTRRHGDYAMAGVAIAMDAIEPVTKIRIAMFSISDRALRVAGAEAALEAGDIDDEAARLRALEAIQKLDFHDDMNASSEMKKHLAQVVFKRALSGIAQ